MGLQVVEVEFAFDLAFVVGFGYPSFVDSIVDSFEDSSENSFVGLFEDSFDSFVDSFEGSFADSFADSFENSFLVSSVVDLFVWVVVEGQGQMMKLALHLDLSLNSLERGVALCLHEFLSMQMHCYAIWNEKRLDEKKLPNFHLEKIKFTTLFRLIWLLWTFIEQECSLCFRGDKAQNVY